MQDDVSDGVAWAIEQGIADPQRVAIYGGSYGGYAALSGLTKTPELYRCGISYVGVSNLFTWIAAIPPYWKIYLEMIHEMVGHPERDAEQRERRGAHGGVLVEQVGQPARVEVGRFGIRVGVETRQRRAVAAREAQRAHREDALGVDHVPQDLADAPLAGRVRPQRRRVQGREQRARLVALARERRQQVAVGHLGDVAAEVGLVLGGRRAAQGGGERAGRTHVSSPVFRRASARDQ
jgi:hypothetical protein